MKKIKAILLQAVRLDGAERESGDVVEISESLLNLWKSKGYCAVYDEHTSINPIEKSEEMTKATDDLKQLGGEHYEIPKGKKVRVNKADIEESEVMGGGGESGTGQ